MNEYIGLDLDGTILNYNAHSVESCDRCGKFVHSCTILADGDSSICVSCWGERCAAVEAMECIWIKKEEGWQTSCGALFIINEGTPSQNGMLFCHHCGNKLVEDRVNPAGHSEGEGK